MPSYSYDRLSAQDNAFLLWETPEVHMHVSATQIYKAGPLKTPDGGIDIAAIKQAMSRNLHRIPRYRQKLQWIPVENHAVWVDDSHFNIDFHIRHTSLPRPGSEEQLKKLAARIMAQQLDRARPLWEIWVVEGLEGDRFAFISKTHHCMIDGASGIGIADILMSTSPDAELAEAPVFIPRTAPTSSELFTDSVRRRLSLPFEFVRSVRRFRDEVDDFRDEVTARVSAVRELMGWSASPPSKTPINQKVGPHRKIDWLEMPLADVKAVRKALDCTVNDVVLTTVTGAVRDFLMRRQVRPEEIDFRVSAPVSVRREGDHQLGNQVSSWVVALPVAESDPKEQLAAIHEETQRLKESKQALGIETIIAIADWTTSSLLSMGAQASSAATNTIVTNVPGPQMPLYMLGAEMMSMFPQVPLLPNLGLGIALISYNGRVCWGFNADADMIPDLDAFKELIAKSFARLATAAEVTLSDGDVINLDPEAPKKKTRSRRSRAAAKPSAPPSDDAESLHAKGDAGS
ncbi:MAG: wax ester/triacylglycerol synthase family O-acyltransferase [Myxococcales bacterium]|nr:wax ester/triacylglycerol synthase family O-acyltransferase [Myxococcales bacterium]